LNDAKLRTMTTFTLQLGTLFLVTTVFLQSCVANQVEVNQKALFVPTSCRQTCQRAYNVSAAAGPDFTFNLANANWTKTAASTWAFALLKTVGGAERVKGAVLPYGGHTVVICFCPQVKKAVATGANNNWTDPNAQNITITPPAVAKLLGVYSIAVYQAFAVWSQYLYSTGMCVR
jgi:hypothetical protein